MNFVEDSEKARRRATILLALAAASGLVWLVHSFAVRELIVAIEQAVHKFAH